MALIVRDSKLKNQVFKKLDQYHNKAESNYKKGNMKLGKKYEKLGDDLYKKNYKKMFKVVN